MSGSSHGSHYRGRFNQFTDVVPPRGDIRAIAVTIISKAMISCLTMERMIRTSQLHVSNADVAVIIDSVGKLIGIKPIALAVEPASIILPVALTEKLLRNQEVDSQMLVA